MRDPSPLWSDRTGSRTGAKRNHSTESGISLSFSLTNISLKQKKCLQLNNNYQNFVSDVVFDILQVNLVSAFQKTVPRGLGTMSSFFGGVAVFSARTLGSDQTFQTLEKLKIKPYRLRKELCSDFPNHATKLSRPYTTLWSDYPDSVWGSDQTVQTVSSALIWPCRLWTGSWSDYEDRRQWCQTVWSGWTSLREPVRDPSRSDLGWLGSRTSSWELSSSLLQSFDCLSSELFEKLVLAQ